MINQKSNLSEGPHFYLFFKTEAISSTDSIDASTKSGSDPRMAARARP